MSTWSRDEARSRRPSGGPSLGAALAALLALGGGCGEDVGAEGRAPMVSPGTRSILEDEAVTLALLEHAEDPDGDALTVIQAVANPAGTVKLQGAGTAGFVPPPNYHGPITIQYVVSDGRKRVNAEYHLDVRAVNDPPVAVGFTTPFRFTKALQLSGSDVEEAPLRFEILEPPAHGTLTGEGRDYLYTADAGYFGEDRLVYRVHDGELDSAPATVTLQGQIGTAPVVAPRTMSGNEDERQQLTLAAADGDGDAVTFAITQGPTNGTLSGELPDLLYTPNADYHGTDGFTFSASDGILPPVTARISLVVLPVPDRPVATPLTLTLAEDTSTPALLQGSDPDGTAVSYTIGVAPQHGTLEGSGAQRIYRPAPNYHGEDTFTYYTSDGSLSSDPVQVTITVSSVPDAPQAPFLSIAALEDALQVVTLGGSDSDGDLLTHTVLSQPANGQLAGTPPALTYTPNPNFHGVDSFTYSVTAGGQTTPAATVTLHVASVNDAPVAEDGAVTTPEDTAVAITLQSSDLENAPLTYTILTAPSDGTLSGGSGAARTYTPAANAHGTRSFTFHVSDGAGGTDTATVSIEITPVNDAPTLVEERLMTEAATPITVAVLDNDVDVDGDAFSLESVTAPAHGTAVIDGDEVVYTPEPGFVGVEEVSYVVTDEHGASATARAHIGVETLPSGMPAAVIATAGNVPNTVYRAPSISHDGRFVAFLSRLALIPADTNGLYDVYLYDRGLGQLSLASQATGGGLSNADCQAPHISGNGRYVVFHSSATNLVAGDDNAKVDVFRHDRVTGETVRVSVADNGGQANGSGYTPRISDDGKIVAFLSSAFNLVADDAAGAVDAFVRDLEAGTTTRVSVSSSGGEADGASSQLALSGDGQVVAFVSVATNLVAGDSNEQADVFVHERATGATSRASISSTGGQGDGQSYRPSLSREGRFVAFLSYAGTLVPPTSSGNTFVRDRAAQTTVRAGGYGDSTSLTGDGRYLAHVSDSAVRVRDRFAATSQALSSAVSNRWFDPSISGNGRYVVYLDSQQGTVIVAPNPL